MNQPLISVIVPIYNVEKYLDKCVDSIINQTYKNLEIILVDDGSPDNCPAMCDNWAKKDSRIKVIHKTNGGLSDARNHGLDIATGEYVTFVDSDDWLELDGIESLVKPLKDKCYDIVIGGFYFNSEKSESSIYPNQNTPLTTTEAIKRILIGTEINHSSSAKLYNLTLFKNIRYPKGKFYEDFFTVFKIVNSSKLIYIINAPIYHYWKNPESITQSITNIFQKTLDFLEATCDTYNYLINNYPGLKKYIIEFCIKHAFTIISLLKDYKSNVTFLKTKFWINSFKIKELLKESISYKLLLRMLLFRISISLYLNLCTYVTYIKNKLKKFNTMLLNKDIYN